ncbi:uncharacterized protein LOC115214763 [Argonauta hians]
MMSRVKLLQLTWTCLVTVMFLRVMSGNPVPTEEPVETTEEDDSDYSLDNEEECQPQNLTSCPPDNCCVTEILAYQPTFKGEKSPGHLVCRRMRDEGELCILKDALHICPCREGLECLETENSDYGHCSRQ